MAFRLRTSFKYAFSKSMGQRATSIMILVGIAVGLVALLVISAVMNGLQNAQLDQLRNLESFDLIVDSRTLTAEKLDSIKGVDISFCFLETNVLVVDKTSGLSTSARMRAYDSDVFKSVRMGQSLFLLNELPEKLDGIVMSYTTMNALKVTYKDEISITFLKKGKTATIVPFTRQMPLNGLFSSRMSEFSSGTLFMDYDELAGIIGAEESRIGVYVSDNQANVVKAILGLDPNATVTTWQEYNRALYSALMLEKTMMYIFLLFMFLIICVNMKNSTRRLLCNKAKEGAMLRAIGCSRGYVNSIFMGQGLVICLLGEALGVLLGELIISNIRNIFKLIDDMVFLFTHSRTILTLVPFNAFIGPAEIALVCLFVFLLSAFFTYMGCRRIYKSEIMEVILNASY